MVASPEFLGHFIFNSDYPTDKIIWLYEGEMTTDSNGDASLAIGSTDLPYLNPAIFIKGIGSVDNWQSSFRLGADHPFPGSLYDSTSLALDIWKTTPENSHLQVDLHLYSHKNTTVKIRLWGFFRDDIPLAVESGKTANVSKNKVKFDTDKNYPRIFMEGVARSGETLAHNLGKIPFVEYWWKDDNFGRPKEEAFDYGWTSGDSGVLGYEIGNPSIRATKDLIYFAPRDNGGTQQDLFYYYRLYA